MRKLLAAVLFLAPAALAPACSQAGRICEKVCECEHCNDILDDYYCDQVRASDEIAGIYGCSDEWGAYADCFEDEGSCNEENARYSSQVPGTCSSSADSGMPCMDTSDCLSGSTQDWFCEDMTCRYPVCDTGNDVECRDDSDCPGGDNKCKDQLEALEECLVAAAGDPSFLESGVFQ